MGLQDTELVESFGLGFIGRENLDLPVYVLPVGLFWNKTALVSCFLHLLYLLNLLPILGFLNAA